MKVYFNKYIIDRPDTHFVYTLAFKSASGKTCFKDGTISFFNVGEAEEFFNIFNQNVVYASPIYAQLYDSTGMSLAENT